MAATGEKECVSLFAVLHFAIVQNLKIVACFAVLHFAVLHFALLHVAFCNVTFCYVACHCVASC